MIRADGNFSAFDKAFNRPATVVDFPDPVVPTIAECLVSSLFISTRESMVSAPAICPTRTK